MADLALYEHFLEHARVTTSLLYRRQNAALQKMDIAFEMLDLEFVGIDRLNKSVCRDLIHELEPYLHMYPPRWHKYYPQGDAGYALKSTLKIPQVDTDPDTFSLYAKFLCYLNVKI